MVWYDAQEALVDTDDDSFGSPGSPPPTPSDISSEFSPPSPHGHDTYQLQKHDISSETLTGEM